MILDKLKENKIARRNLNTLVLYSSARAKENLENHNSTIVFKYKQADEVFAVLQNSSDISKSLDELINDCIDTVQLSTTIPEDMKRKLLDALSSNPSQCRDVIAWFHVITVCLLIATAGIAWMIVTDANQEDPYHSAKTFGIFVLAAFLIVADITYVCLKNCTFYTTTKGDSDCTCKPNSVTADEDNFSDWLAAVTEAIRIVTKENQRQHSTYFPLDLETGGMEMQNLNDVISEPNARPIIPTPIARAVVVPTGQKYSI